MINSCVIIFCLLRCDGTQIFTKYMASIGDVILEIIERLSLMSFIFEKMYRRSLKDWKRHVVVISSITKSYSKIHENYQYHALVLCLSLVRPGISLGRSWNPRGLLNTLRWH